MHSILLWQPKKTNTDSNFASFKIKDQTEEHCLWNKGCLKPITSFLPRNSPFLFTDKAIQGGSSEHHIPEMQERNGNVGGEEGEEQECVSCGCSELDLRGKGNKGKGKKEKERTEELKDKGREEKERR